MAKKYTFEEFSIKVKDISNDTIDLSEFNYINSNTKGICKCKICGNVWETKPCVLLRGHKCRKCYCKKTSINKTLPFDVIQERINVFNPYLKLKKDTYIDTKHKCLAICDKCGYIWNPRVNDLLNGHCVCMQCQKEIIKNKDKKKKKVNYSIFLRKIEEKRSESEREFIKKSKSKYGEKFDYDMCYFLTKTNKVLLYCKKHNHWFYVTPKSHLIQTYGGCDLCYNEHKIKQSEERRITVDEWKEKCKLNFDNKYNYDLVTTIDNLNVDIVNIICPIHGVVQISARAHYYDKTNCPKCTNRYELTKDVLICKCNEIHNGKYNYGNLEERIYNRKEKIKIFCSKHGIFQQRISDHLSGCGCPKCNMSHLERVIINFLEKNNIEYCYQAKFDWLGQQSLDFYLPQYNLGIECQGSQHFFDSKMFKNKIEYVKKLDEKKRLLCKENGVNLIYYFDKKYNKYFNYNDNKYFNTTDELINYIYENNTSFV